MRRWPRVTTSLTTLQSSIGLTLSSLYLCEEASGNMADAIGGFTLTAAGTPVYRDVVQGKAGVGFNSTSDGMTANVNDLAAASGVYFAVNYHATLPDTFLFGRINNTGSTGACVAMNDSAPNTGRLRGLIRDGVAAGVSLSPTSDVRGKVCVEVLQVDRGNAIGRMLVKPRGEAATEATDSIAGYATLTAATQLFGLCNFISGVTSQTGDFTCLLLGVATGTQCAGANVAAKIAAGLGF
jgi:hypothetical protein